MDLEHASQLSARGARALAGPALTEFADEPLPVAEPGAWEEARLAALEQRLEAELALGRQAELAGELEALSRKPHRERFRAQLIVALYRSSRQAEALAAYRDAREALDELGIEPGARLSELERQVPPQDAALDLAPQAPVCGRAGATSRPARSERRFRSSAARASWRALRSLLERAEAARAAWCCSTGEPGGGKTRLVRELAHTAAGRARSCCTAPPTRPSGRPYQPLREWLAFLLRVCDPEALKECLGSERWATGAARPRAGAR